MAKNPHYGYTETGLYTPDPAHMARAIELGHACIETGDHPVGAVVVSAAGVMLGEGKNEVHAQDDPTTHAEFIALNAAVENAGSEEVEQSVLITTHECCPMCSGAAMLCRVEGIVYSTSVDDITHMIKERNDIKWRSNAVRMETILKGDLSEDAKDQFIIGGFMHKQGFGLLGRAAELVTSF